MKYVLVYQICSVLYGYCYPPLTDRAILDSWSDCVVAGSEKVIELVNKDREVWEKNKFMVKYYCNVDSKNKANETPT